MKYEVSDDFIMASIMSGAYGDAPNPQNDFCKCDHWIFVASFILSFSSNQLVFRGRGFSDFVSSTTVTYVLFEKLKKKRPFMLLVLLILFFK